MVGWAIAARVVRDDGEVGSGASFEPTPEVAGQRVALHSENRKPGRDISLSATDQTNVKALWDRYT